MLKITTIFIKEATEMKSMRNKNGSLGRHSILGMQGCVMKTAAVVALVAGMAVLPAGAAEGDVLSVSNVATALAYDKMDGDIAVSVKIPEIQWGPSVSQARQEQVNAGIRSLCEQYVEKAEDQARQYRRAFLDTGGSEAEWKAHGIEVSVWYEILAQTDDYLSLGIMGKDNWSRAHYQAKYYTFDCRTGEIVTLQDILGDEYQRIADVSIQRQMVHRWNGKPYYGAFTGVDEDTSFYVNERGNPVVVFPAYEIAPGSEGRPEFEIIKPYAVDNLSELTILLGMDDRETARLFGGGTENWSADRTFFVGRTYEIMLHGQPCRLFTICGRDKTVDAVSIWIVGGERPVTAEDVTVWAGYVTAMMGTEPTLDPDISEGGSRNRRWTDKDMSVVMHQMPDILTISIQPAVGELH